jgi:UDP-N-acetylglucosamine---dolichyl-phosphate N-acetylglucosaminyltransferase
MKFVVIPAYNEENHIKQVISETKKYISNIIVVDDGSKDKTIEEAKKENVIVLKHIINLGKGAALKTGCDYAIEHGASQIIALDADTQHEPLQIPDFFKELENVDVVLGYRKLNKEMPSILKLGNWFINKITKLLYGITLHDTQCGYRAFTADAYKQIKWKASNYSMESEMIANIGKKRLKYKEIPIKTIYADKYKGTTLIDGIKIVCNLFWWRLSK